MVDIDYVYGSITEQVVDFEKSRRKPPLVRIWDGDWTLFSEIHGEFSHSFKFIRNDTGNAVVELPLDHFVSEWALDRSQRPNADMHLTFDKDGARWSGKVNNVKVTWGAKDKRVVQITAKHDYEHLKKLMVWPNPFLPAEVQIPKSWTLIGPARWAAATTLFVQLLRKNASLWMLPDDPLDIGQWINLDMSNWNMVVKPVDLATDSSPLATVSSRFKNFHDCVEDIMADAQLSIEVRRFLDGDPPPIPGMTIKHGALVVDFVDKSGWNTETSFGGNLLTGLNRAVLRLSQDGMTEGIDYIQNPEFPKEYSKPGWLGTLPQAPWVVLEDGKYTGVESTEYEWNPPGPVQFVTGGQSLPGVNEAVKATITAVGGMLGAILAGQTQLGAVINAIAEPLYTDTLFAFQAHKMHDRIRELGSDFYYEHWVDGSDRAYTLSALIAMRKAKFETREKQSATIKMNDAAPYAVGQNGFGDFFISDRVAIHAAGMPKDILFVEQIEELEYKFSETERGWEISVGQHEAKDALLHLYERYIQTAQGLQQLGVL